MNALTPILERTRSRLADRRAQVPQADIVRAGVQRVAADPPRPFQAALTRPGLSVIAEHKRRSPSAGSIREDLALEDVVGAYERGGAAAVSVLTEPDSFGGELGDLDRARRACRLPLLRKDFIVDPYQVHEALAAGADAVLLIVAALDPALLDELFGLAASLGLAVLVEVHDADELQRALALSPPVIGINNRDLTTLRVQPRTTFDLLELIPPGTAVVAESGFRTRDELDALAAAGVDAVLIGEALMRSPDVEAACRALTAAAAAR